MIVNYSGGVNYRIAFAMPKDMSSPKISKKILIFEDSPRGDIIDSQTSTAEKYTKQQHRKEKVSKNIVKVADDRVNGDKKDQHYTGGRPKTKQHM